MLMKLKLDRNNYNQNIVFNLDLKTNSIGTQKDVDDFISYETDRAMNKPTSDEILIFKPISSGTTIQYSFNFSNGITYTDNITAIGITQNEASGDIGKNSFYLLEFYDSFDSRKQTKRKVKINYARSYTRRKI